MLQELNTVSKSIGLYINQKKTKFMTNDFVADVRDGVEVDGQRVDRVEEYSYLGQMISMETSKDREIRRRITLTWQAIGSL